jgi:N utilization substance protein B
MGKRRKSRELALQLLYQYEMRKDPPEKLLDEFRAARKNLHKDIRAYAEALFTGTLAHLAELDEVISEHSLNWKLSRLSSIDRNILRFSLYEIFFREDIPEKVTMDEAIEISKRFSGEDAGGFINGILDSALKDRQRWQGKFSATLPAGD